MANSISIPSSPRVKRFLAVVPGAIQPMLTWSSSDSSRSRLCFSEATASLLDDLAKLLLPPFEFQSNVIRWDAGCSYAPFRCLVTGRTS
jgi:hypothetical protein